MQFSCEKSILQDAIQTASRAVSNKSPINLLEGLLITADDGLTLCGYNLSMGIRVRIGAMVTEPGKVVLNAQLFGNIIRKLPDDVIYFETNENGMATIRCGKAVFNLMASSAEEFPKLPEVEMSDNPVVLQQNTLKAMVSQTIFAVSDNESKPIHTGCLFEANGTRLNVVAVDGYRLSIRREELPADCGEERKFVVPGTALREIERILADTDDLVQIYPDPRHILFQIGDTVLITRLLEGEFLNYRAAIPETAAQPLHMEVSPLITALERVSLIASEKLKNPIRMTFEEGIVKLSCITAIGKSYDECPYEGTLDALEIGFNSRYLLEALRACPKESVCVTLKGNLNPIVFTPEDDDSFTYLVLPVRLKA